MHWVEILGYAASVAVLASFCMSTMIPLRILALVSNVLFAAYGYFDNLYPVLLLHTVLFPINLLRLIQFRNLVRDMRRAETQDLSIQSLLPYMRKRHYPAGTTLVKKGDDADRLFYLAEGEFEIVEIGKVLQAGALVGEIGVFAPNQKRTATILCRTDCRVFELSESTAKQLYFQDRAFGFAIMRLIIARLTEYNDIRAQPAGAA